MVFLILLATTVIGVICSLIVNKLSNDISGEDNKSISPLVVVITVLTLGAQIYFYNLDFYLIKSICLSSILIVMSFVDIKHKIIPNRLVLVTFVLGLIFLFVGDITVKSGFLGMIVGGIILFLLALIPGALGGGDVKLVFALGLFLGLEKTVYTIFGSFIIAAIVSVILLVLKVVDRKGHIPFGPFIGIAALISFILL